MNPNMFCFIDVTHTQSVCLENDMQTRKSQHILLEQNEFLFIYVYTHTANKIKYHQHTHTATKIYKYIYLINEEKKLLCSIP